MVDTFNVSEYLGVFLDEADEQLERLSQDILELEKNGEDKETIQKIFRAAHTLKGSSGAMGFVRIQELTYGMENVLDKIRKGEIYVSSDIITLLFECLDALKELKESVINQNGNEPDISQLLEKLSMIEKGQAAVKPAVGEGESTEYCLFFDRNTRQVLREGIMQGHRALAVYIKIIPDSPMKSIRAFLIANNLKEVGELITSFPSKEELDNDQFEDHFIYVLLTSENESKVIEVVNSVSEIVAVSMKEITLDEISEYKGEEAEVLDFHIPKMEVAVSEDKESTITGAKRVKVPQMMRVDVDKIDSLMNLIGELVINQTRVAQISSTMKVKHGNLEDIDSLLGISQQMGRIVSDIQESVMKVRMLPIEQLFNRFPRMIRDLSMTSGKQIDFIVEGQDTELDRTIIEEISDPLIHLLRNSVDHGIEDAAKRRAAGKPEQGMVKISARHKDNLIEITVEDDGKGIHPQVIKEQAIKKGIIKKEDAEALSESELIHLIFMPGFSTAAVVNEVSGRGVGMDIVRSHIEKLNGIIDIETVVGKGSKFVIKLPLTLAIIPSLLVRIHDKTLAVSLSNVMEIVRVDQSEINILNKREAVVIRGKVLPLVRLHERFGGLKQQNSRKVFIVVVGSAEKRIGLVVDKLLGNQDVVIKTLGKYIGKINGVSGATILGDGKIALILDTGYIIKNSGKKLE